MRYMDSKGQYHSSRLSMSISNISYTLNRIKVKIPWIMGGSKHHPRVMAIEQDYTPYHPLPQNGCIALAQADEPWYNDEVDNAATYLTKHFGVENIARSLVDACTPSAVMEKM